MTFHSNRRAPKSSRVYDFAAAPGRRSIESFREALEAVPTGMLMTNSVGEIVLVNAQIVALFGYSRRELLGRSVEALVPPRFRGHHAQHRQAFFKDPKTRPMGKGRELYGLRKDGSELPIEIGLNRIQADEGDFVLSSIADITVRRHAEEREQRAAEAEQLMNAVVRSAEDAILTKTLEGVVRSWNPAAELMLGYRAEEIIGTSGARLIPEDRLEEETMILGRVARGERVAHLETVRCRKDGSPVEVSLTVSPIRDDKGNVVGASKIMRDITARKRAEAALKRSHERIAFAAQAAGQGFWEFNVAANTLRWDDQMFQLYGRSILDGEQPYALWVDSLHPEDRERCERELGAAIAGLRPFDTDFRIIHPDGAVRHIQSLARVTRNPGGRAVQMFGINCDITERKRATEQLRALNEELEQRVAERTAALASANVVLEQKNEEVEAFVYIVSHDLRAPLVNIQGFASEILRSCGSLEETLRSAVLRPDIETAVLTILRQDIAGALTYISASTTKFQRLIDTLLLLSRTGKQELRLEEANVRAIVETTISSLRQTIQSGGAEVLVETLPGITGDVTAIGQVFSNLISNALKYSKPGRPARIIVGGQISEGQAHYWVRDNGAGIPASAQRRLFQVFQRFHPDLASGDGMGLAIVKRIVERHGGRVWAESEEDIGTTFHVELPAAGEKRQG
jgi:PAS domain S-box-containing protein